MSRCRDERLLLPLLCNPPPPPPFPPLLHFSKLKPEAKKKERGRPLRPQEPATARERLLRHGLPEEVGPRLQPVGEAAAGAPVPARRHFAGWRALRPHRQRQVRQGPLLLRQQLLREGPRVLQEGRRRQLVPERLGHLLGLVGFLVSARRSPPGRTVGDWLCTVGHAEVREGGGSILLSSSAS